MIARALQIFSVAYALVATAHAAVGALQPGNVYPLVFRDVDGNDLSTTAGHATIITVITRESEAQAGVVGGLVPDRCVGNPKYRYVTLVNFKGKLMRPVHGITRSVIRGRLDAEAKKLRPRYAQKNLTRDPRKDIYVIADFDGSAAARLGLSPGSNEVAVFVFNGAGKLVARWSGVPPGDALSNAIAAAE